MKKIFLFALFFCCFTMVSISMYNISNDAAEEIDLLGNLASNRQRSLMKPIQTFITGQQFIETDFNVTLGSIEISVYDEVGNAVYRQFVTTYAGQHIFIDIASFNSGEYSIKLTNSQGRYLEGNFVIE